VPPFPSLQLPLDARVASIAPGWQPVVQRFLESDEGRALERFLAERAAKGAVIYPPQPFHALELTDLAATRVVIVGQDPYHGQGQAHGLAFSVPQGVRVPPSLRNIFLEQQSDLGCVSPAHGNLERWARQGVLLLNAVMSVEDGQPACHAGKGWERLTDRLIGALTEDPKPKAFLLWGAYAQAKRAAIVAASAALAGTQAPHLVLTANHPSPLSARRPPEAFLGCRHFSRVNTFLREAGRGTVDWCG
jgi:uracil-DNA glycosylase